MIHTSILTYNVSLKWVIFIGTLKKLLWWCKNKNEYMGQNLLIMYKEWKHDDLRMKYGAKFINYI